MYTYYFYVMSLSDTLTSKCHIESHANALHDMYFQTSDYLGPQATDGSRQSTNQCSVQVHLRMHMRIPLKYA
jgi:hypothetical protein